MATIMINYVAHVEIQAKSGEYKYVLLEAERTSDIRKVLDENGYSEFVIKDWKLLAVDGVLIKER